MHQTALDALETLRECLVDDWNMDASVRRHTELAVHHLELAAEIEHAIENENFTELLDAIHQEAGIASHRGFELGGAG